MLAASIDCLLVAVTALIVIVIANKLNKAASYLLLPYFYGAPLRHIYLYHLLNECVTTKKSRYIKRLYSIGLIPQISSAYSRMVRSLEKYPEWAIFSIDRSDHLRRSR